MGVALGNNGTRIVRADMYYNDNGVIKNVDDMEVWTNNNGTLYKFPQKENCLLNLDTLTWQDESFTSASSYITTPFLALQTALESKSDFGSLVTSTPTGNTLQVKQGDYWYLPNGGGNKITLNENIIAGGSFTIAMTTRFERNPTSSWRDILLFQNPDIFRLEWNGSSFIPYSANISGSQALPTITRTEWFQIVVVVENTSLKIYQNGVLETDLTMSRNLNSTSGDVLSFYTQRGTGSVAGFGCNAYIRDFQVWKTALTDQEVADLRKWLFLD